MQQGKAFHYSIVAGWFVTTLAIVLVATILVPEESRSTYFWRRVGWTEFLVLLFWGSVGLYFLASGRTKDNVTRFGGIAPTVSLITAIYTLIGFSLMLIHAFIPETDAANRIHLIGQVVVFSGAALCVVFLSMARVGATAGLDFDKTRAMSPRELHDLLILREASLPADKNASNTLKAGMKHLREAVLYSFNESASLSQSPQYQTFSGEIQDLCLAVEGAQRFQGSDDRYQSLADTAKVLVTKAKLISSNQVRRY